MCDETPARPVWATSLAPDVDEELVVCVRLGVVVAAANRYLGEAGAVEEEEQLVAKVGANRDRVLLRREQDAVTPFFRAQVANDRLVEWVDRSRSAAQLVLGSVLGSL